VRITRIDHVAVCVANIDHQLPSWLNLLGLFSNVPVAIWGAHFAKRHMPAPG